MPELTTTTALAPAPRYAARAIASPTCMSTMALAASIGACWLGLVGTALIALAIVVAAIGLTWFAPVRRCLDRESARRKRDHRDAARLALMASTSETRQEQYMQLRNLVAIIERDDGALAERMELDALLQSFVQGAVRHQRCLDAMQPKYDRLPTGRLSPMRRAITTRRIECRDRCEQHAARLSDELDAIEELIRLVAQKTACPEISGELDAEIAQRLEYVDQMDTALRQLSA